MTLRGHNPAQPNAQHAGIAGKRLFDCLNCESLRLITNQLFAKQLDKLARKIAGNSKDALLLQRARTVAAAELDLARVRRIKVALIERLCAVEALDAPWLMQ
jgi:hypothetical protein